MEDTKFHGDSKFQMLVRVKIDDISKGKDKNTKILRFMEKPIKTKWKRLEASNSVSEVCFKTTNVFGMTELTE